MTAEDHYKECKKCPLYDSCVVNKNRKMLNNALFQERLGIILQRVSLQGYHATLRELQSFTPRHGSTAKSTRGMCMRIRARNVRRS